MRAAQNGLRVRNNPREAPWPDPKVQKERWATVNELIHLESLNATNAWVVPKSMSQAKDLTWALN